MLQPRTCPPAAGSEAGRRPSVRVVKEVEAHFAILPPDAPEFDHYAPAEFLMSRSAKLRKSLPELDAALDRFQRLFDDLNGLLLKE